VRGAHRGERRRWVGGLVVLVLLAGAAGTVYAFREDLLALVRGEASDRPTAAPSPSPTPTPTPSPTPTPTPTERPKGRLVIHGTGDVNVDPSYIPALASNGHAYAWAGLDGLFRRDDLTVINLECAVSDLGSPVPKEFNFRGDPAALGPMRRAGIEVANLGNNHSYDFGPEALLDSVRNVRRAGIAPVGAGATQKDALRPAILRLRGWKVAVVGLDQVVDPFPDAIATMDKPGTAAGHDTDFMLRAIRNAERRADIVIVTIHWGVELDTEPRAEQVELGQRFVRAGADVIFGHHSHRLQPMERFRGAAIFWGLGNFVWPDFSAAGARTAVARVIVKKSGKIESRLMPAFIESPGHPVLTG
jgi:poly-gamma-glutamate capsule biosynthesis protein CapA/YwtB (metallophosphatase superfamily)